MREGGSGVTSRGNRGKWRRGRRRALGEEKVEKQGRRRPFWRRFSTLSPPEAECSKASTELGRRTTKVNRRR